ncbi:unnamed protein product, partial [Amoebophrya sp. A25]|eukprot:GSA25T00003269001.1
MIKKWSSTLEEPSYETLSRRLQLLSARDEDVLAQDQAERIYPGKLLGVLGRNA